LSAFIRPEWRRRNPGCRSTDRFLRKKSRDLCLRQESKKQSGASEKIIVQSNKFKSNSE
jgi:hypothetical protein